MWCLFWYLLLVHLISHWLVDLNFFLHLSIQKSCLNFQLIQRPTEIRCKRHNYLDRCVSHIQSKGLVIVNFLSLREFLCDKSNLYFSMLPFATCLSFYSNVELVTSLVVLTEFLNYCFAWWIDTPLPWLLIMSIVNLLPHFYKALDHQCKTSMKHNSEIFQGNYLTKRKSSTLLIFVCFAMFQ